jgi:cbb3-type cytochrome oxidase cytochrome c subunit
MHCALATFPRIPWFRRNREARNIHHSRRLLAVPQPADPSVIGGMVEIVPLFTIETTVEKVKGVRPYTPLELAGRDIYVPRGLLHLPQPA